VGIRLHLSPAAQEEKPMSEPTPPSQEPKSDFIPDEFKLRREVVYNDFIAAGCTVKEAEELCVLIHATYV
jgi:hypothetical protein